MEAVLSLSAFAKAIRDGNPIMMGENERAPLVDPRLSLDQLRMDHFESHQKTDLADFSDAFDNIVHPSNFMDVLYQKHVGEGGFDPAFETYRMSIDMTGYLPILSEYDQEQQSLQLQLFPDRFEMDLSGLPLSVKVGFLDQPWEQWHSAPLEVKLGEEPAEAVVPLMEWLRELGIDGRPMIVDLFVTGTDQDGQEHHQRVAGASVRMEAEMPLLAVPLMEGVASSDEPIKFSWEAPNNAQQNWNQVEITISDSENPIYVEAVDYVKGEARIPGEVFDRGIYEYEVTFNVDGKSMTYPLHDHRREEKRVPVIQWKLPAREWKEGDDIGKEFFPTIANYDGQEVEGTFEYAGAAGEMRGKDRQLLRATFTPTDLDRFGIAVAFRSLKMQSSPPPPNAGSIATHHQLLAAGQNNQGQLGGPPFVNWTFPMGLSGSLDIQDAVAGDGFTLMLTQAGDLWGVGSNAYGQLGDGSTDTASVPVWVAQDVQDIEAGRHHALFLTSNGDLFGMGRNQYGQLGDGTLADQSTPVLIDSGVSAMAAGTSFSIFLKEAQGQSILHGAGRMQSNPASGSGGPSVFDTSAGPSGTQVFHVHPQQTPATSVTSLFADYLRAYYIDSAGDLWGFGYGTNNAGGWGPSAMQVAPIQITNLSDVTKLGIGQYHSVFLSSNGDLSASGQNDRGQLGHTTGQVLNNVTRIEVGVLDVAAGDQHTLIIRTDGQAYATGNNWQNQLGVDMGRGFQRGFIPVSGFQGAPCVMEKVVAGNNHSLFLRETLSLNVLPQVLSQLPNSRFELQTPVAGGAGLQLQWFKDGDPLPGETGDVLARDPLSPADAGEYSIHIRNGSICAEFLMASLDVSCAQDTMAPVITLIGDSRVQLPLGVSSVDPGAVVTDDLDPSVQYTVQGAVDATREGVYELTYHATDACGNQAIPLTRTVTISALRMIPDAVGGRQGSEVFVPFRVSGFTNMEDLNLSIEWDPGFMELVLENGSPKLSQLMATDINGMITPLFEFGSGPLTPGRLRMQWIDTGALGSGYSYRDGTVLFALHFTLVGDVGTSSTIGIDSDPNLFTVEWAIDRSANITTVTQPAGVIILDKGMLNREVRLNEAGPMRSFGFKGGKVRVEFDTQLGETYLLEYSASLGSPEWQLLGTRQGTGRAEVFEVPAGGGSGGFFRMLNR